MKKAIFLGCMGLLFVFMALASYAGMTKESLSPSNVSDLKGKWEGWRTGPVGATGLGTELEIYNDTVPLKGKITYHDVKRRGMRDALGDAVQEFKGIINNDGNLYTKWGQNYIELSLYKDDGKMKLDGDFYFQGFKGTMTLNKK
jgi:hypothetical protein